MLFLDLTSPYALSFSSSSFFSFSISSTSSGKKMAKNPPFIICLLWFRNYDSRMIWCPKPAIAFTWLSSGPFDFTLNNLFQSSFVLTKIFVIYCFCGLSFYKERKGLFFLTNLGNNWPLTTFSSLIHFKIKSYLQELIRGSKSLPHGASGPQRLRPQLDRKDFHPGPFFSQRFQL